jgi:hypothetical protein
MKRKNNLSTGRSLYAAVLIILGTLLIWTPSLKAQVSGVSASKLTAIDATLVAPKTLEAEPSFTYLFSKKSFGHFGHTHPVLPGQDSAILLKDLFFRFTYGAGKNLEIGTFITDNLSSVSFGAKYRFIQHKKFLAVALLGFNFSDEPNFGIQKTGFFGKSMGIASGIALTENFTSRFSLDVAVQYQSTFSPEKYLSNNFFLDSDLGYYVYHGTLQLIGGISLQYNNFRTGAPDAYLLSIHPGVTIEPSRHFLIVFYAPVDIAGKNTGKFTGFSFAFTFTID